VQHRRGLRPLDVCLVDIGPEVLVNSDRPRITRRKGSSRAPWVGDPVFAHRTRSTGHQSPAFECGAATGFDADESLRRNAIVSITIDLTEGNSPCQFLEDSSITVTG